MINLDPIHLTIQQYAGFRIRDQVWEYLIQEGAVEQFASGALSLDALLDKVRRLQAISGPPLPVRGEAPQMLSGDWAAAKDYSARDEALSLIMAEEMERNPYVEAFRKAPRTQLPSDLLRWEDVQAWLFDTAGRDASGAVSKWRLSGVPLSREQDQTIAALLTQPDTSGLPPLTVHLAPDKIRPHLSVYAVLYAKPGDDCETVLHAVPGGVLDELRILAEYLADFVGWSEAQAVLFVLTGIPPLIAPVTASADVREGVPALSRIELSIDPTLSPREVAEEYRKVRQWFIGSRHRDLSDKHLQLALFAARERHRSDRRTWAEQMAEWNHEHVEWSYSEVTNFARDATQATKRLLGTVNRMEASDGEAGQ